MPSRLTLPVDPNLERRQLACLNCMACPGTVAMANAAAATCPLGKFLPWQPVLLVDAAPAAEPDTGCCDKDPKIWGPPLWKQIHERPLLPFDVEAERRWFTDLPKLIPCCHCKSHLADYSRTYPIDLTSPTALRRWTWGAHNAIRERLGQPPLSWEVAAALWKWP